MTLNLNLNPELTARLTAAAQRQDVEPQAILQDLVIHSLPATPDEVSAKNAAAIAMLSRWIEEDATDDPEEIRKADEEVEELKRNMNANRAATGERLVFP